MPVPLEKSFFNLEISFICAINRIDPSVLTIGGKKQTKTTLFARYFWNTAEEYFVLIIWAVKIAYLWFPSSRENET